MKSHHFAPITLALALSVIAIPLSHVHAASAEVMNRKASQALNNLYARSEAARRVGEQARGILVFPEILKGGFVVGAQQGDGTLFVHGQPVGYYKTVAASYGLQAGLQKFGYALFFMTDNDLAYLRKSRGWEIGTGPNITIVDTGLAKSLTTTTLRKGVYAFVFSQKGLMAGLGIQGSKITPLKRL